MKFYAHLVPAVLALLAALPAMPAVAATVSLARSTREVTPEEIAVGAPAGGFIHDFFITSDTDLLSVSSVQVDIPLFHHLLGSDFAPPPAAVTSSNPGLSADSYIDTPGDTFTAGGGFSPGPGDRAWGDVSNDGPLANFHFARLTTGQTGFFSGRVAVRGYDQPVYLPFNFVLPGVQADLALLDSEPVYSLDYSLEAPPQPEPPPPTPPIGPPPQLPPTTPPVIPPTPPIVPPGSPPGGGLAARLALTRQSRQTTPEEIAGGAPAGAYVHEFFVTSATDVLSVNSINVSAPLYQHALGGDAAAPIEALVSLAPAVTADSFITTPGETGVAGGGIRNANSAWFDTSNDGAQEDFLFARLTVEETGTFSGSISVRHDSAPVSMPFDFLLPGNEADMGLLASEQTYAMEFPLTPPPVTVPPPVDVPPYVPEGPAPPPPAQPPIVDINLPPLNPPPIIDPPPVYVLPVQPPANPPGSPGEGDPSDGSPSDGDPGEGDPAPIKKPIWINPRQIVFIDDLSQPIEITGFPVFTRWIGLGASIDNVLGDYHLDGGSLALPGLVHFGELTTTFTSDGMPVVRAMALDGSVQADVALAGMTLAYTAGGQLVAFNTDPDAVIPEPSTALLAAPLLALLLQARRQRRSRSPSGT